LPEDVRAVARIDAQEVSLNVEDPVPVLRTLTTWATDRGVGLPGLQVRRPSLEDVYLELTRAAGEDGAPR
jgi:ABC-2 type transport system ATP-binding protein